MSESVEQNDLPEKYEAFVEQYLIDLNGTQAYKRTYPDCTMDSARASAARLLANVSVQDAIAKACQERSKRCEISQDDILKYWKDTLYAPKDKVHLETVNVKRGESVDSKNGFHVFRAPERFKASQEIAKHLGMYPNNKIDLTTPGGITVVFDSKKKSVL